MPDNAAASLNGFIVHISLPALTLAYVHGLHLDTSLILPALMAWVMFGMGCGFFWLAGRMLGFSRSTIGGLMDTIATLTSMALQYGVPLDAPASGGPSSA